MTADHFGGHVAGEVRVGVERDYETRARQPVQIADDVAEGGAAAATQVDD